MKKLVTINKRTYKCKKAGRKMELDRVNIANSNAQRPGFNDKFLHPRSLRNKTT